MPLYVYQCDCEHRFELRQGFDADTTQPCPSCGDEAKRQIQAPAIQFKGSGFFSTDSKGDGRVLGESGKLGTLVSETDGDVIDRTIPTNTDAKGKPKATATLPRPARKRPRRF